MDSSAADTEEYATELKIAHLSDLHFSKDADPSGTHCHSIKLLQAAEKCLAEEGPDYLIVSGDISNNGDVNSLLRARDWLVHRFSVGYDQATGLSLPASRIGVVPGNHDAWNSGSSGRYKVRWQRSLENYLKAFPPRDSDEFVDKGVTQAPAYYDWLTGAFGAVYIAFVDSSFCGDSDSYARDLPGLDKIARGKLSVEQSAQLLRWHDSGIRGTLPRPDGSGLISASSFSRSLKILVMHHYLLEPVGFKKDYYMQLDHRQTAIRNVMLSQFDMVLCGHKHHADVREERYASQFNDRARARLLLNCFRRLLGLHGRPLQLRSKKGRFLKKMLSTLVQAISGAVPGSRDPPSVDALMKDLRGLLDGTATPIRRRFAAWLEESTPEEEEVVVLSKEELDEIANRIIVEFTPAEKKELERLAQAELSRSLTSLGDREFVQVMCGSTVKAFSGDAEPRSFNVYRVRRGLERMQVLVTPYRFDVTADSFLPKAPRSLEFVDSRQLVLPFASS